MGGVEWRLHHISDTPKSLSFPEPELSAEIREGAFDTEMCTRQVSILTVSTFLDEG